MARVSASVSSSAASRHPHLRSRPPASYSPSLPPEHNTSILSRAALPRRQVYNRGGEAAGEYMYTLCMAGGLVSAVEDDGERVVAGHVGGGLSAWRLLPAAAAEAAAEADDVVDGEAVGCQVL